MEEEKPWPGPAAADRRKGGQLGPGRQFAVVLGVLRSDRDQQAWRDPGQLWIGVGQDSAKVDHLGGFGKIKLDLGPTNPVPGQGEQTKCYTHVDRPLVF